MLCGNGACGENGSKRERKEDSGENGCDLYGGRAFRVTERLETAGQKRKALFKNAEQE